MILTTLIEILPAIFGRADASLYIYKVQPLQGCIVVVYYFLLPTYKPYRLKIRRACPDFRLGDLTRIIHRLSILLLTNLVKSEVDM